MKVIWENGKPDSDCENWLCPNCKRRPAGNAIKMKNGKAYCIYCDIELDFRRDIK